MGIEWEMFANTVKFVIVGNMFTFRTIVVLLYTRFLNNTYSVVQSLVVALV